ncbi:MAG: ankyrin repeat domain-containing protein [Cyanobacteria bacterium MAG CAR1_bin_15]|nr:ankyrin repeat domain-containing protein [Cyanobacteria bacterium MAG CAR1_bin_15]
MHGLQSGSGSPQLRSLELGNFFEKASVGDVAGCLKEGADPNTRDKYGLTPLHRAARNSAPPLIKALLDAGADVNARDKNGATPLHFAVGSGNTLAVAQVLLDAGADPSARNNLGLAPLSIAAAFSKTSVAILNSTRPPHVTPYSYTAGLSKIPGFVQTLLDAGADPNTRDKYGFTPLHWAAIFSKIPAVVQVLLDAGADPGAKTENGLTALDLIPDDSPLRGTDVERQLNDAGF